jgi:hypothetical protein
VATWEFVARFRLKTHLVLIGKQRPSAIFHNGKWVEQWPVADEAPYVIDELFDSPNPDISVHEALLAAGLTEARLEAAEESLGGPSVTKRRSARGVSDMRHMSDTSTDPISGTPRPGNPNFCLVDGYGKLLGELSAPITDIVHLDAPVTAIDWSEEGVVVHASNREFRAKTAILSLPIGVLQGGAVRFWPALPQAKLRAISQIDTGPLIKINVEFRRPWWEDRVGVVPSIRNTAASSSLSYFKVTFWDRKGPPLLSLLVMNPLAAELTGDAGRIRSMFLGALGEMFPDVDLESELVNLDVADWASDPWTMGGISEVTAGHYQARAHLAAPTPPLFWCGEATHTRGHAECVHGALETGRRAAYEVIHATQPMYAGRPEPYLDWRQYTSWMR